MRTLTRKAKRTGAKRKADTSKKRRTRVKRASPLTVSCLTQATSTAYWKGPTSNWATASGADRSQVR
jgi:hypothetical protein